MKKKSNLFSTLEIRELKTIMKLNPERSMERKLALEEFSRVHNKTYVNVSAKISYIKHNGWKKSNTRSYVKTKINSIVQDSNRTISLSIKNIQIVNNRMIITY